MFQVQEVVGWLPLLLASRSDDQAGTDEAQIGLYDRMAGVDDGTMRQPQMGLNERGQPTGVVDM